MARNSRWIAHMAMGRRGMVPLCSSGKEWETALEGAVSLKILA